MLSPAGFEGTGFVREACYSAEKVRRAQPHPARQTAFLRYTCPRGHGASRRRRATRVLGPAGFPGRFAASGPGAFPWRNRAAIPPARPFARADDAAPPAAPPPCARPGCAESGEGSSWFSALAENRAGKRRFPPYSKARAGAGRAHPPSGRCAPESAWRNRGSRARAAASPARPPPGPGPPLRRRKRPPGESRENRTGRTACPPRANRAGRAAYPPPG